MKRGDAALYEEGPGPLPGYAPLPSAAAPAPWQGGGGGAGGGGMYAAAATVPGPQPGVSYLYEGGAAPGAPLLAPAYGGGSAGGAFPGAGALGAGAGADDVFGYDVAFASRAMRHAFVRKVLGVVCCQLLLTAAVAAGVLLAPGGGRWVARNAGWALPAAAGATFGTLLLMLCSERARRAYPGNLFLLGVFTAAQGLLVGVAVAAYSAPSVVLAVVMSAAVCLALTAYAFQTRYDFTASGGILYSAVWVLLLAMLGNLVLRLPALDVIIGGVGALVFCCYIVYDLQLLVAGEHSVAVSVDEPVFAALNLYIDVINLFLFILRLVGQSERG